MTTAKLYYECHVNFEAFIDEEQREALITIAKPYGFHVAKLVMVKGEKAKDSFATLRGEDYEGVLVTMAQFIMDARQEGFKPTRYKIEDTLLDSRKQGDFLQLLG